MLRYCAILLFATQAHAVDFTQYKCEDKYVQQQIYHGYNEDLSASDSRRMVDLNEAKTISVTHDSLKCLVIGKWANLPGHQVMDITMSNADVDGSIIFEATPNWLYTIRYRAERNE